MKTAYTDYPVGAHTGTIKVELLAYDRDKYVTVRAGTDVEDVKTGYLFQDKDLKRHLSVITLYSLPSEEGKPVPTRLKAHAEMMKHRRRHKTRYSLWVGDKRFEYSNLHDALRHFGRERKQVNCVLFRDRFRSRRSIYEMMVESENGLLCIPVWNTKPMGIFRQRHKRIGRI